MRLTELDPRWLTKSGKRIGFIFISPIQRKRSDGTTNPTPYRQTCFVECTSFRDQCAAVWEAMSDLADSDREFDLWQSCRTDFAWTIAVGIENATFETMTVSPSIDGSAGGLWHGFIKNGAIT